MASFMDKVDVDSISLDTPIRSDKMPRWERKLLASANKINCTSTRATPCKTPASKGDRFIANRGSLNVDRANRALTHEAAADAENGASNQQTPSNDETSDASEYRSELSSTLLAGAANDDKILAFKHKAPAPEESHQNNLRVLYSATRGKSSSESVSRRRVARHIAQTPERILDAPGIVEDYYLNLLDWSKDNVLAIALDKTIYLWDASNGDITELTTLDGATDYVTSLQWVKSGSGAHLAVGTNSAAVQLWDVTRQKQLREMRGHQGRVTSLSWNKHMLSSGARDGLVLNHDVRVAQHLTSTYTGHTQEVCGLAWSNDGATLASGGNDNLLLLWDARQGVAGGAAGGAVAPAHRLTAHQAAVKALAWCPWQANLLVSGAGTADRHLRFWNSSTGACVNSIDTGSQVCAVQWSRHQRELVSSHGFSQNQLCVWSYPTLAKVTELYGHSQRVLHMAQSPDGQTVCSVSPDETLRFWKIWSAESGSKKRAPAPTSGARSLNHMNIR
eukprot:TRINITY_DN226_c0_g3_i1.p1 TRINITY_DN226_c0_g3~~TRINITY_DN226_c0_g3_i1.p1  ORF type:complete len:504 (+),score=298.21 TRINITY_DN226_c0_g3_i1:137-1648(+)